MGWYTGLTVRPDDIFEGLICISYRGEHFHGLGMLILIATHISLKGREPEDKRL